VRDYDPAFSDGPVPTLDQFMDPDAALGPPDYSGGGRGYGAVSLGGGGRLELGFGGRIAGNSGDDDADIRIYEVGPNVERTAISLAPTAESAALLGIDDDVVLVGHIEGSTRELDVDTIFEGFAPGELAFTSIVLLDELEQGWTNGER